MTDLGAHNLFGSYDMSSQPPISASAAGIFRKLVIQSPESPPAIISRISVEGPIRYLAGNYASLDISLNIFWIFEFLSERSFGIIPFKGIKY